VARRCPPTFRIPAKDIQATGALHLEPVASLGDDLGFADEPSMRRKGSAICPKLIVPLQTDLAAMRSTYCSPDPQPGVLDDPPTGPKSTRLAPAAPVVSADADQPRRLSELGESTGARVLSQHIKNARDVPVTSMTEQQSRRSGPRDWLTCLTRA